MSSCWLYIWLATLALLAYICIFAKPFPSPFCSTPRLSLAEQGQVAWQPVKSYRNPRIAPIWIRLVKWAASNTHTCDPQTAPSWQARSLGTCSAWAWNLAKSMPWLGRSCCSCCCCCCCCCCACGVGVGAYSFWGCSRACGAATSVLGGCCCVCGAGVWVLGDCWTEE